MPNAAKPLPADTSATLKGYKLPLTPVRGGFGYYGTVAYDKQTKRYTQCHICGHFYKAVGAHIVRTHNKSLQSYKVEYGLSQRTSLAAPVQKIIYRKSQDSVQRLANLKSGNETMSRDDRIKAARTRHSLMIKNLEARCPDQLMDKVMMLKEKLKRTPTRQEFVKEYGHGPIKSIRNTFGSWGEVKKLISDLE